MDAKWQTGDAVENGVIRIRKKYLEDYYEQTKRKYLGKALYKYCRREIAHCPDQTDKEEKYSPDQKNDP
jgi:hypothetical protein